MPSASVRTNGPWLVVRGVWAALSLALFWFVAAHQSDVPWGDEYDLVPVVTGHRPLTAEWLWSPHNEHRIPLPRLAQLGILRATGNDFRAGTWVIAVILSGLALGGVALAERVRGRSALTDVFFPLVGLHWGQVENLVWNWQLVFVLGVALTAGVLTVVVLHGKELSLRPALFAGACLVLLPLCGGNGLLTAAPLAVWLGTQAVAGWGSPRLGGIGGSVAVLASAATAAAVCGVYFVGLKSATPPPPDPSVLRQFETALGFLAVGFGPVSGGGWRTPVMALAMTVLLASAGTVAGLAARRWPGEWRRAAGLLGVLATFPVAAVMVGHARATDGAEAGLQSRYATLWLPAWWAIYFAFLLYLRGSTGRVALTACAAVGVLMQGNAGYGLDYATRFRDRRDAFDRDLDAGVPSFVLAQRYFRHPFGLCPYSPPKLDEWLTMLGEAGVGRFAQMRPNPPRRDFALGPESSSVDPTTGGIRLTPGRTVYAARVALRADAPGADRTVDFSWRAGAIIGNEALIGVREYWDEHTIWINGPVEEFRLSGRPGGSPIAVGRIIVSVPPDGPASPAGPPGVR